MSKFSELTRQSFSESDKKRDEGLTTPAGIVRYDDLSYGDYGNWNLLDVYRPKDKEGVKLPVIVSVHGGSWVYGDKEVYQYYCMSLAVRGFAVVNFTYRLAPEYKFPASVEDTDNVLRWIYENADTYGLDTENVFAVGDSAGAHILGIYSNFLTNKDYAKKLMEYGLIKEPQDKISFRAIALNCGKYSMDEVDEANPDAKPILDDFLRNGGDEKEIDLVNVLKYITDGFPPSYIMTCYGDFLKKEAGKLISELEEEGVPFEYHFYGSKTEPLGHVFHCNVRLDAGQRCNDDECDFFRKYL